MCSGHYTYYLNLVGHGVSLKSQGTVLPNNSLVDIDDLLYTVWTYSNARPFMIATMIMYENKNFDHGCS